MTQTIMVIQIKESGLLALPTDIGRQYDLHDSDILTLIHLGGGAFLLVRLPEKPPTLADLQQTFGRALNEAGYDTPEKIITLVREVKRESVTNQEST